MNLKKIAKQLRLKKVIAYFNFSTNISLNGKKFRIPIIKNMGLLNLKLKGDWFIELLKELKLKEGTVFLDVGVNVGQTLLSFRSVYNNPYYGFEPNASCVFYLHNLIELNNLRDAHILPVGLSSKDQVAKFFIKNESDSAGTVVPDLRPDYYQTDKVSYVPLFSFDGLKMKEVDPISAIKVDVEGAELEVLSGMIATIHAQLPLIICEILDGHSEKSIPAMQERANKLVFLLKDAGYLLYRIKHPEGKIHLQKVEEVKLKLWGPESFDNNDYLFVPEGKQITIPIM